MLKWLHAHGAPCNVGLCLLRGVEHGHMDVVRRAAEQGATAGTYDLSAAASGGHWRILCALRELGVPWDVNASHAAATSGHLSILQRMVATGAPLSSWVVAGAAARNHSGVVKWLGGELPSLRMSFVMMIVPISSRAAIRLCDEPSL